MGERLYGLDWLRIGAFGLLIFYHIGMFFVPWGWHIKAAHPVAWLELPMQALSPWRLSLLFLISGTASAFLLAKCGAGGFARSRSARLLIPLAAGMILFVPPQPWIELTTQHGYANGFWHFWTTDYFRFGTLDGIALPTWNHLWFVVYLWAYTMMLALAALALPKAAGPVLLRATERALRGWRLLAVPLALLWAQRMLLFPLFPETHALVDDWYNHASYGLMFAIGLALAHSDAVRAGFRQWRRPALLLAVAGYIGLVAFELAYPDDGAEPGPLLIALGRLARAAEAWGAIVALVGYALGWRLGDSAARRYLTEAVFPYYIAHQTIIVVMAYWLRPLQLGNGATALVLIAATVAGSAAAYELARRSGPLRPIFGLKRTRTESRGKSQPFAAHSPQT